MRLLLADDQIKVRSALRLLLEQEPDFQVVGEAADATVLLRAVTDNGPDVILLDWELPGLPVTQLLRRLHYERPSLKIIAMSSRPEAKTEAQNAGIVAFLSKGGPPETLRTLLQTLKQAAVPPGRLGR